MVLTAIDTQLVKVQAAVSVELGTVDGDVIVEAATEARNLVKERFKRLSIAEQGTWAAVRRYDGAKQLGDDPEDASEFEFQFNI